MSYNCWICNNSLDIYTMLPYEEDYFGEELSIFKQSIIIKDISPFKFLYFTCCDKCICNLIKVKYLNKDSSNLLKYIRNREIGNLTKSN